MIPPQSNEYPDPQEYLFRLMIWNEGELAASAIKWAMRNRRMRNVFVVGQLMLQIPFLWFDATHGWWAAMLSGLIIGLICAAIPWVLFTRLVNECRRDKKKHADERISLEQKLQKYLRQEGRA